MKTVLLINIMITAVLIFVKNKKIVFATFSSIIVFMFAFSVNNPDYIVYKEVYMGLRKPSFTDAPGFLKIMELFNLIGAKNYVVFTVFIAAFVVFVFGLLFSITPDIIYAMYVYLLFVIYYDVLQIRFAVGSFLILIELFCLIKKKPIWMIGLIAVGAITIHWSTPLGLIFVLYLYATQNDYRVEKLDFLVVLVVGGSFALAGRRLCANIALDWNRMRKYVRPEMSWSSLAIWSVCVLSQLMVFWIFVGKEVLKNANTPLTNEKRRVIRILYRFLLLFIVLLPCTSYLEEIGRIFRIFMVVMAILYAVVREDVEVFKRRIVFGVIIFVNWGLMLGWIARGINPDAYWGWVN